MNWDDLRIMLAIARTGSLSGAARNLKVDQSTVGRRLTSLETQVGVRLFLRSRSGFRLTDAGESVLAQIEVMETAAMSVSDSIGAATLSPSGLVRIATMPWILNHLLAPALPSFAHRYPKIELHGIADLRERSLSNREAELALRFEMKPRGRERAFQVAKVPYAVYAPRNQDPTTLPWIGSAVDSGEFAPENWLNTKVEQNDLAVCFRSNDAGVLHRALRAGVGIGLLPEVLAEADAALVRLSEPEPEMVRNLRVLVHPDVERFARITVVIDWLKEVLSDIDRAQEFGDGE